MFFLEQRNIVSKPQRGPDRIETEKERLLSCMLDLEVESLPVCSDNYLLRQVNRVSYNWANFIVDTGQLPSWPLIEIRRPWN